MKNCQILCFGDLEGRTLPFENPSFSSDTEVYISLADHAHPWKSVGPGIPGSKHQFLDPELHFVQHWALSGESSLGLDLPHPLGSAGCQEP